LRDDLEAWLRLTLVPGISPGDQQKLLLQFKTPHDVLRARSADVHRIVEPEVAAALDRGADASLVARTLEWAARPDRHVVVLGDAEYPETWMQIAVPPTIFYAIGDIAWLSKPAIAIVGSRNATRHGVEDARDFSRALANAGLTIVSGLAHGVDAAAHRGALDAAAGSTVAVMGTGPDRVYPRANAALAQEITARGCLVTEFPVETRPVAGNFPRRNRLISGLARAVLVVQAAQESGSLITARYAVEQGRDVFAIPGSIHSTLSKGCHKLIKDGAKLVDCVDDILLELGLGSAEPRLKRSRAPTHPLLQAMGFDPVTIDELIARVGGGPATVAAQLSELEIEGSVEALAGGRFQALAR
jgi:DNA processing protein